MSLSMNAFDLFADMCVITNTLKPEMNSVARFRALASYQEPGFQARHDKTIILGLRRADFPEEVAAQQ